MSTGEAAVSDGEASLPWPGEELVFRSTGGTSRETFYDSGRRSVRDLEAILGTTSRPLSSHTRILDFGCGCGRIMLWLRDLAPGASLHGTDVDSRAVKWLQANLPWAEFGVNHPVPPLDYPDGFFDLVYSHSVFTHIDEENQDLWLAELRRVTAPGGQVVLSVHGEHAFTSFELNIGNAGGDPTVLREQLSRKGIAYIEDDAFAGGPFPDNYHSTFHAPWYVFEHWGQYFTVSAFVPRGSIGYQDFVLLTRPPGDEVQTRPIAVQAAERPAAVEPVAQVTNATRDALAQARATIERGPDVGAPSRAGPLAHAARRLMLRALRDQTGHDREVASALAEAVGDSARRIEAATSSDGVPLAELDLRLFDAVRLQGERINRLEADVTAELEALADRIERRASAAGSGDRASAAGSGDRASAAGSGDGPEE